MKAVKQILQLNNELLPQKHFLIVLVVAVIILGTTVVLSSEEKIKESARRNDRGNISSADKVNLLQN